MNQAIDIREELGLTSNTWLRRNLAFLEYFIGEDSGKFPAISGERSVEGTVDAPTTRLFETSEVGGYSRAYDAEVKLFETVAAKYSENPGIQGFIHLFSERQPCESCENVINQFQAMFPNIVISVEWYQDTLLSFY